MKPIHTDKMQVTNVRTGVPADDEVPEGFTLGLALVDALPVLFFCAACIVFGGRLGSPLFVVGSVLAFLGGAGKVLWKLLIALAQKNVAWLGRQMRVTMPIGFVLMLAGAVLHGPATLGVLAACLRVPSLIFVVVWVACMAAMFYFAGHRDQMDARSNWMEEGVNAVGQGTLLLAVLLA